MLKKDLRRLKRKENLIGQVIKFKKDSNVLIGGSDPRRDGCAIGM